MQSYYKINKALNAVGKNTILNLTEAQRNEIATILTLYKSDERRKEKLCESGIPEVYIQALLPLSFSKFGSLSIKAMEKLIPLLEEGKRYDEACAEVFGDHHAHSVSQKKSRLSLDDMDHEITNPVARRAIAQTIKVINAIVRTYGPPDVVNIELAREMNRSPIERKNMENRQKNNQAVNEKAKEAIEELKGDHVTGQDIVKYKLYQEQDGYCLYSGERMDSARLFEQGYVEVDHIIPYSRCFDDSYQNKVLVLARENQQKGNRLPYEYFGAGAERWQRYEARVNALIKTYGKRQKLLKKSLPEEEERDFIQRNLNDTQYITRSVFNLLRDHLAFADSKYSKAPVQAFNGAVTAMLRKRWGIRKIREDGDLHHCLDAVVIAAASPGLRQRVTEYSKRRERYYADLVDAHLSVDELRTRNKEPFPEPWDRFRQELEARLADDPRQALDRLKLATYESDEEIRPVFVSRMPRHKVTGEAHEDTIRSGKAGAGYTVSKVALTELKLDKNGEIAGYYNPESDMLLYNALRDRLLAFNGNGKTAFAEPFYKPKRDGTLGPPVNKVKIKVRSSTNLAVRGGVAENGNMIRIDVFHVPNDGYYYVPIYASDICKAVLPNKAVVAGKKAADWKAMKDEDFLFSLYHGDLVEIQSKRGVKLTLTTGGTGEKKILHQTGLYYYCSGDVHGAAIELTTHDRRYEGRGVGIKTLLSMKKYQVDVLGHYSEVHLPEKRMPFSKEK